MGFRSWKQTILENKHADFLSCRLRWTLVPLPSYLQTHYIQYHKWRRHISSFSLTSQLFRFYRFSGAIGALTPHMLWDFRLRFYDQSRYYCRNSSCSACRHLLQDLNHLFLEYLPLSLYANHIWVCSLHPGVWLNCCVSAKFFCFSSLGRSWVAPSLKRPASKIKTMQHALPIVENNQAFVPNIKKSTFMQR